MQSHSPLRYPGGKGKMAGTISGMFDRHGLRDYTYIEPFTGGGAIALELLYTEKAAKVWINDLDKKIYCFWKYAIEFPEDFCEKIESCNLSINEWYRQRDVLNSTASDEKEIGFSAFYLNRTSFSGVIGSGPIGGYSQTGDYHLGVRFDKKSLAAKINRIGKYKSRITLTNWDARRIISFAKYFKNAGMYVDPPYVKQGNRLYYSNLEEKDHRCIGEILQKVEIPWILTYDNDPLIVDIYKDNKAKLLNIQYSMSVKRTEKEIMITNVG